MSNVPVTSRLHLLETSRDGKKIHVALVFVEGTLGSELNWTDNSVMVGDLEAKPRPDGGYDLTLTLKEDSGEHKLDLNVNANFLFDDQAFFGSVNDSVDGIMLFADQEGGYRIDIYLEGQDYTKALYNHLLTYNDWALKNGYPQKERSQISVNSICEAFPPTVYYEV